MKQLNKRKYNGYLFGGTEMYNPWSLLNYAKTKRLNSYWINTSTNTLIIKSLRKANNRFKKDFDLLLINGEAKIRANLECSITELKSNEALWGLFINSGYATVLERIDTFAYKVSIPNGEVREEFMSIIAEQAHNTTMVCQEKLCV